MKVWTSQFTNGVGAARSVARLATARRGHHAGPTSPGERHLSAVKMSLSRRLRCCLETARGIVSFATNGLGHLDVTVWHTAATWL